MKRRSSSRKQQKPTMKRKARKEGVTIGINLGDKTSRYCLLSDDREILHEGEVPTTKLGWRRRLVLLGGPGSPSKLQPIRPG
jgi:transposase